MIDRVISFTLLLFLIVSCKSENTIYDAIKNTPSKQYENYEFDRNSNITSRINSSHDIVLEALKDMDQNPDYTIYQLSESEEELLDQYISLLPQLYRNIFNERLIGIYFINDFMGSGMADYVLSENGEIYTILILNPIVLESSLSELMTYKDSSCFSTNDRQYKVNIEISDEYSGLLYILMHEATHIVDYIEHVSPYVEPNMKELGMTRETGTPFTDQFWNDYRELKDIISVEYRERIHFYAKSEKDQIANREIPLVYRELMTSPFTSLYSYYSWAEDLAEYITLYYFTQIMGMQYKISIFENELPILEYEPFLNELVLSRADKIDITLRE